jgi:hypothetical protein
MTHRPKSSDPKKARHRSRITNGRGRLLEGLDGRTGLARRYKDIAGLVLADQGGIDNVTQARLQLIRRFAGHCVEAEILEAKMLLRRLVKLTPAEPPRAPSGRRACGGRSTAR